MIRRVALSSRLANALLVTAAMLVPCGIAEIYLRVTGFSYPTFFTYDEHTGIRLRPGAEGWHREEGEAYVRINHDGFRDREHQIDKPAGTLRIAILGDSYAEAKQVPLESTFWARLEQNLRACKTLSTKNVEVLNFGVSGYSTGQELLTLRHYVWRYSPDVVVLGFLTGNDIRDNSKALSNTGQRPFFVLSGDDLVLDSSFKDTLTYGLRASVVWDAVAEISSSLRILQLLNKVKNNLGQSSLRPETPDDDSAIGGRELGLDDAIYREPQGSEWQDAWTMTERLIETMNKEVRSRGAKLLVVSLTNGIQVHPDARVRQDYARKLDVSDLFYPDRRIQSFAARKNIPYLMLGPRMQEYAEKQRRYLHGFPNTQLGTGHWNASGHEIASHLIADYMCESNGFFPIAPIRQFSLPASKRERAPPGD
jgi:hypothetical protein